MKKLIIILLFGLVIQSFPQVNTFLKSIGIGTCNSVVQTEDEGYIAVLNDLDSKSKVIKTDKYGEVEWTKDYGLSGISSIIKSDDGNYLILATKIIDSNLRNISLLKINMQGDTIWTKTIKSAESEVGVELLQTKDGGLIIYGVVTNDINDTHRNNQVIIKLYSNYTVEWRKRYSVRTRPSFIPLFSIIEYGDGYVWLTRNYITKIDSIGNIEWSDSLTSSHFALAKTDDNSILLGGNNIILKVDPLGKVILEKQLYGNVYHISPTKDGNFILATSKGIKKINSDCDTLWSRIFTDPAIMFIEEAADGGFFAIRQGYNFLKTDSLGNYSYIKIYLSVTLTNPYFTIGNTYPIYWEQKENNPIKLEFSNDDGLNWQLIEEQISNTTQYNWLIPNFPSSNCRLRITDNQNAIEFDISEKFTIGFNPEYDCFSANQIYMWIGNNGSGSHDPNTDGAGFYWPGGSNTSIPAVFQDGLIWGGKIDGKIYVNGNTHRLGLSGGPILENGTAGTSDGIWKIKKDWQLLPDGPERDRYEYCFNNWPAEDGAPYLDVDGDNKFIRGIDQPRFLGDEVLWFVANDLDTLKTQSTYGSDPIGLEIQLSTFGYNREDELGDVVFKKYKVINKSGKLIEDMYLSYWSDPDLGKADDDYVGCDTLLNLGFCYNSDNNDDNYYWENPPAVGYKIVQGAMTEGKIDESARFDDRVLTGKKNLPMTSFTLYLGGSSIYPDPSQGIYEGALEFYNNFQGLLWNGTALENPNTQTTTKFALSGDPVVGTGWYEGTGWPGGPDPNDRRFLMSSGPFNLAAGDTQEIVYAIIMARGTDYLNSVTELKRKALLVQDFYDSHLPTNINTEKNIPAKFELYQNYPNPFNPSTTIKYSIPVVETGHAPSLLTSLKVYDILGREVTALVNEEKSAGNYQVTFDGSKLSSGVYFYQLKAGNYIETRKLIMMK